MGLDVLVGELRDALAEGKGRIERICALGEAERSRNAELFALLDRMVKEFGEFDARLCASCGTGLSDYDAVKFLNNMLKLEYRGIFDYHHYAPAFADPGLRETFLKFGEMEIEHARLMFGLIRKMGGTPRPSPAAARRRRAITIKELIEEHLAAEAEAIALCEKGINTFAQPDLQWALGVIRLDEIEHRRELTRIYERFKLAADLVQVNRKYVPPKEIDFDSDEPWTE